MCFMQENKVICKKSLQCLELVLISRQPEKSEWKRMFRLLASNNSQGDSVFYNKGNRCQSGGEWGNEEALFFGFF